jgi:hypothetical protein
MIPNLIQNENGTFKECECLKERIYQKFSGKPNVPYIENIEIPPFAVFVGEGQAINVVVNSIIHKFVFEDTNNNIETISAQIIADLTLNANQARFNVYEHDVLIVRLKEDGERFVRGICLVGSEVLLHRQHAGLPTYFISPIGDPKLYSYYMTEDCNFGAMLRKLPLIYAVDVVPKEMHGLRSNQ